MYLLVTCVASFGQPLKRLSFKIVLILPDTVFLCNELRPYADLIESDYVREYHSSIKQMEARLISWDSVNRKKFPLTTQAMEQQLTASKSSEYEIRAFKSSDKIASYSQVFLKIAFEGYNSDTAIVILRAHDQSKRALKKISSRLNSDYIISYKDIDAIRYEGGFSMRTTTILYSAHRIRKLKKIDVSVDSRCPATPLKCSNPLCCLLLNSAELSMKQLVPLLDGTIKK